jgi:two-component system, chemotaxis family, response regulator Rcp1
MQTATPPAPLALLAIEDNPMDIAILRRVLKAHGLTYDLHIIEDGPHTFAFFAQLAVQEHPRCPDILLLDLHLPGLDGRALLHYIKTIPQCAGLRIVIVTGSRNPADRTDALAVGADAFFEKAPSFQGSMQLGEVIKALASGKAQRG